MKAVRTRFLILTLAALAASGCGIFKKGAPKTPVLGERVAVLATEQDVAVDPATAALPFSLPEATANSEGAQSGGNASKSMGHLALGQSLGQAWAVSIGEGGSLRARLAAAPVVGDGKVYTIDTQATVRAFDAQSGATVWSTQFGTEKATSHRCSAEASRSTTAESMRRTVSAMSPRSTPVTAGSSGRSIRADRSVARRRSSVTRSTRSPRTTRFIPSRPPTARPTGRRPQRSRSPAFSEPPRPRSDRERSWLASRPASSTPIATRTDVWSGRTSSLGPAFAPASRRSRTSMPIRLSITARFSPSAKADAWSQSSFFPASASGS